MIRYLLRSILVSFILVSSIAVLLSSYSVVMPASAAIGQLEEAPGQMLYQSRTSLRDGESNTWQAIAFKRVRPDGSDVFYLRLVGFPDTASIDRLEPLELTTSLAQTLTASDASANIFSDSSPEPNVGQYDLQPVLSQLRAEVPLKLRLPCVDGSVVELTVPPSAIQEWQDVAGRG